MRNVKVVVGLLVFVFIGCANAGAGVSPLGDSARVPTLGDLSRAQGQTVLLKAQAKAEQARNELDAAVRQRSAGGGDDTLPVVRSIFGVNGKVVAMLVYPGNVQVEAVVGDVVPGGYTVGKVNVDTSKVELVRGKQKYAVGLSKIVPTSRAGGASGSAGAVAIPSIPIR